MRAYFLAMLALILAGCASRELWPVERVDPDTAVHVTVMAEPWIYALDDRRQAANTSHFLNVAVVEANRTGTRSYWLNVVSWSTRTREDTGEAAAQGPVEVRLGWQTRQVTLAAAANGRSAAGISEPAMPVPGARIVEAWCPLSVAQVAELGAGAPTVLSLVDKEGRVDTYAPWQVDDASMAVFLKATGAGAN